MLSKLQEFFLGHGSSECAEEGGLVKAARFLGLL